MQTAELMLGINGHRETSRSDREGRESKHAPSFWLRDT